MPILWPDIKRVFAAQSELWRSYLTLGHTLHAVFLISHINCKLSTMAERYYSELSLTSFAQPWFMHVIGVLRSRWKDTSLTLRAWSKWSTAEVDIFRSGREEWMNCRSQGWRKCRMCWGGGSRSVWFSYTNPAPWIKARADWYKMCLISSYLFACVTLHVCSSLWLGWKCFHSLWKIYCNKHSVRFEISGSLLFKMHPERISFFFSPLANLIGGLLFRVFSS